MRAAYVCLVFFLVAGLAQAETSAPGRAPVRGSLDKEEFTTSASGQVSASKVQSSTVGHPPTEQCLADAVLKWTFPKPSGGGVVIVSYPFVLKPSPQ